MKKLLLLFVSIFTLTLVLNAQVKVLDIPILERNDDAEEKGDGSMDAGSSDLEMIYENTDYHNGTGLRFQNVMIPKGAVVTKAYIQFTVDEDGDDGDVTLYIKAEEADNSVIFTDDAFSVSSRTWSTDSVAWTPPSWFGNSGARGVDQQTSDISSLVQMVIDREGWATGNPVTLNVVGPYGLPVNRIAVSSGDGNSPDGPSLHVEYVVGKITEVDIPILERNDDAEEKGDGSMDPGSSDLEMIYENTDYHNGTGLRFQNVTVPKDAIVTRAYIQFTVDEDGDDGDVTLYLKAEEADNSVIFTDDAFSVSSRTWSTDSVAWTPAAWAGNVGARGVDQQTSDISSLVQMVIDREGWVTGNPVTLNVVGPYGIPINRIAVSSGDGNSPDGPALHIEYVTMGEVMPPLVAYWSFDEGTGLTIGDSSGNGNDGTLTGDAQWVEGAKGKAIYFNDESINMQTAVSQEFSRENFSMSMWVRWPQGMQDGWHAIAEYHRGSWDDQWWGIMYNGPSLRFIRGDNSPNADVSIDTAKWYNVTITLDAEGNHKLYLDGELIAANLQAPMRVDSAYLTIGANNGDNGDGTGAYETANAMIDEIKFYDGVLTKNQIKKEILNTDLVAHWMFDETSGNVAHDISGNGLDLVMANTTDTNWVDGGAMFNGVDQYAILDKESTHNYFENPNFTISTWLKVEEDIVVDGNARIAGMDDPYGINLKDASSGGRVKVYVYDGSGWTGDYITKNSFSDGTWHHLTITHDTINGSAAYIDGAYEGSVDNPDIFFPGNSYFAIAASISPYDSTGKWYANAGYKDFRAYDRVLSEEEIGLLAGLTGKAGGQAVYYDFEDFEPGDGNKVTDMSENLRDGTQNGPYINKIDGVYGSAIQFNPDALGLGASADSNNNCVVLPEDKIFASQSFTVSAWINVANDTLVFDPTWGEWGAIFAHDIGGDADYGLFYDPYGATMGVWSEGMGNTYLGGGTINVGEWAHVALTVSAEDSVMTLYVNGEDVANTKLSVLLPKAAVADTSCIGGSIERSKPFFGAIDEFEFYDVALDSATIAEMAVRRYMLTTEVSASGGIDLGELVIDPESEDGYYSDGASVVLTATPINDGYVFSAWEGAYTGTDNPLTIAMDSNIYLKAVFVEKKYNVTINIVGPGTVSPESGEYTGLLIVTATPDENAKFSHWSGDIGAADSSNAMLILTVDADMEITANFIDITGIEDNSADGLGLQAYPNPFSDFTTIKYELEESSEVRVSVLNMVGKEVMVLEDQFQNPGEYTIEWNGTDASGNVLPNGMYIYRIKAGDTKVVNKKLLINR